MELKDSCRLCMRKQGEFYKLFNPTDGGCTLADELNHLLDFKIEEDDDLPDSICANCFRINSFFKEFRTDCARVKDRLQQLVKSGSANVSVKLEKTNVSEDDLREDGTFRNSGDPRSTHPGSLVESLRSDFHAAVESGVNRAPNDVPGQSLEEARGKKRRNENSVCTTDAEGRAVVQEPLLAIVKSEYISDEEMTEAGCAEASDLESDSHQLNDTTSPSERNSRLGDQNNSNVNINKSLSPSTKRQRMEGYDSGGGQMNSTSSREGIRHQLKEEEIEIFDCPEEDEFDPSDAEDAYEQGGYSSDPLATSSSSSFIREAAYSPMVRIEGERVNPKHFPVAVSSSEKGKKLYKKCKMCSKKGIRRNTGFYCPECPMKPGLCLEHCFIAFHNE